MNELKMAPTVSNTELVTVTPMTLLQMAITQPDVHIEKMRELMELNTQWEKHEARKAYVVALNAFKANPPDIFKTKQVAYGNTKYKHAQLDEVSTAIGRALSQHGICHTWDIKHEDGGVIKVTCILTHERGHSESVSMQALADSSGNKNSIQACGSTVTYLERYTLLAATGMAAKDQDDDARSATQKMSEKDLSDWERKIKATTTEQACREVYQNIATICKDLKDKESADYLKGVAVEHKNFIQSAKKKEQEQK